MQWDFSGRPAWSDPVVFQAGGCFEQGGLKSEGRYLRDGFSAGKFLNLSGSISSSVNWGNNVTLYEFVYPNNK